MPTSSRQYTVCVCPASPMSSPPSVSGRTLSSVRPPFRLSAQPDAA